MIKLIYSLILVACTMQLSFAQGQGKFFTRTGHASFFSKAAIEDIEAQNNQTSCILNTDNGEMAFSIPMKGFDFKKALMQEHFNENYIESDDFPKATFKGRIQDFESLDLNKGEAQEVVVAGDITIHGVTKAIETVGKITSADGRILAEAEFRLTVKDFNIKIPKTVINNIAKEVLVSIKLALEPYKK